MNWLSSGFSSTLSWQWSKPSHLNRAFRQTSTPDIWHLKRWSAAQLSHWKGRVWDRSPQFPKPLQSADPGMHCKPLAQANMPVEHGGEQRDSDSSEPSIQCWVLSQMKSVCKHMSTPPILHLKRWSAVQLLHWEARVCERSLHPPPLPLQTAQYGMHPDPSLQANWSDGQDREREERFVDTWYISKGFGFSKGFRSEGIFARVCHLENKWCCSLKMPSAMSFKIYIFVILTSIRRLG